MNDWWRPGAGVHYDATDYKGWMHECPVKHREVWWPGLTPCRFCGVTLEVVSDESDRPPSQA